MTQKTANENISPSQGSDLNEKILDKLKKIQARFDEISQELEKPENTPWSLEVPELRLQEARG